MHAENTEPPAPRNAVGGPADLSVVQVPANLASRGDRSVLVRRGRGNELEGMTRVTAEAGTPDFNAGYGSSLARKVLL